MNNYLQWFYIYFNSELGAVLIPCKNRYIIFTSYIHLLSRITRITWANNRKPAAIFQKLRGIKTNVSQSQNIKTEYLNYKTQLYLV